MPTQVLMPALSPTMEEGKLAKWMKAEGDEVHSGDVIAEIETDKATMEVEAVDEGKLGKILVPEGTEGVKVNTPIAVILSDDEDASALTNGGAASAPSPQPSPQRGGSNSVPSPLSRHRRNNSLRLSKMKRTAPRSMCAFRARFPQLMIARLRFPKARRWFR